jgi:hypothetical protein
MNKEFNDMVNEQLEAFKSYTSIIATVNVEYMVKYFTKLKTLLTVENTWVSIDDAEKSNSLHWGWNRSCSAPFIVHYSFISEQWQDTDGEKVYLEKVMVLERPSTRTINTEIL